MTARFLTELDLRPGATDSAEWAVMSPFRFEYNGQIFEVPAGFPTDLASVPRLPLMYWLTGGTATKPAVAHDWLYRSRVVDRATADAIFLELCEAAGVPWWRRRLMYAGVRLGGGAYWNDKDPTPPPPQPDTYFG